MKPTIAVDFDGTLVDHAFPAIGPLKPGAREALTTFRALGYHILIYSCRTCRWHPEVFLQPGEALDMNRKCVREMVAFLDAHQVPYDEIDDGTRGKPLAVWYIDDRAVSFQDNWQEIETALRAQHHS